ncbi:hypothetical protein SVAN01_06899 [Stagonosporopsis vannaccii]|nr:hypothetical protein SVAN01_06899 [Stagonosporopsis vannaccii]
MPYTTISYLEGGTQQDIVVRGALSACEIEKLQEYLQNDRAGALRLLRDVTVWGPGIQPQMPGRQPQMPVRERGHTNSGRWNHVQPRNQVPPRTSWTYANGNGLSQNRAVDNGLTQSEIEFLNDIGEVEAFVCRSNGRGKLPEHQSLVVGSTACASPAVGANPFGAVGDGRLQSHVTTSTPAPRSKEILTLPSWRVRGVRSLILPPLADQSVSPMQVEMATTDPQSPLGLEEPIELLDVHKHPTSTERFFRSSSRQSAWEKSQVRFSMPDWCPPEHTL